MGVERRWFCHNVDGGHSRRSSVRRSGEIGKANRAAVGGISERTHQGVDIALGAHHVDLISVSDSHRLLPRTTLDRWQAEQRSFFGTVGKVFCPRLFGLGRFCVNPQWAG
jgi:hypothetical protein